MKEHITDSQKRKLLKVFLNERNDTPEAILEDIINVLPESSWLMKELHKKLLVEHSRALLRHVIEQLGDSEEKPTG